KRSNPQEAKPLYVKIHFDGNLKLSKLKQGSIVEGTLSEAVYSGEREVFPAGSSIRLTVDRLERVRRPANDHWPWVVKAFSPRHKHQPVFPPAGVLVADDRKVPLGISLISMSEKNELRLVLDEPVSLPTSR